MKIEEQTVYQTILHFFSHFSAQGVFSSYKGLVWNHEVKSKLIETNKIVEEIDKIEKQNKILLMLSFYSMGFIAIELMASIGTLQIPSANVCASWEMQNWLWIVKLIRCFFSWMSQ